MQNKTANEMSDFIVDKMIDYFGKKVDGFLIYNIDEDKSHKSFCVKFKAYDYFIILCSYERGRFGCSIKMGDDYIPLPNSQKWWDETDFDKFFKELQSEIELRIPDKYLEAKGWK